MVVPLDRLSVRLVDGAPLLPHADDHLAGVLGFLLGVGQGKLGDLFGHQRIEVILSLEVAEIAVGLVEGKGIGNHAGAAHRVGGPWG